MKKTTQPDLVLEALQEGAHAARVALARRLARVVDDPETPPYAIASAARVLVAVLEEIERTEPHGVSWLDEIRERVAEDHRAER